MNDNQDLNNEKSNVEKRIENYNEKMNLDDYVEYMQYKKQKEEVKAKEEKEKHSAFSTASKTLGILSMLFCMFWYAAIPCGVLAIVFGKKSIHEYGSKRGKSGLAMGIIGLSACAVIYITLIFYIILEEI